MATSEDPADRAQRALARVTHALPGGGEERPGQVEMARRVAAVMAGGGHLVVQAGTGTGKSLAYLVPAALSGKKVVVATATKALQDQLASKDLPLLEHHSGVPVTAAVLKGRSNYVCRQRIAELSGSGVQQSMDDAADDVDGTGEANPFAAEPDTTATATAGPEPDTTADPDGAAPVGLVEQVQALLAWTESTESGDRADLPFEPVPRAWSMISVGPRECPGAYRCPSGGTCFTEMARDAAANAEVVVVNTHLYGAHLASQGAVLPPHDVVVFDEAHQLEEVMTAALGVELTPGRFRAIAAMARPLVGTRAEPCDALARSGDDLRELLAGRRGERVLTRKRTGGDEGSNPSAADDQLASLLERARQELAELIDRLRAAGRSADAGDPGLDHARHVRALTAAGHLAGDVDRLAVHTDVHVAWIDGPPRLPVLHLSPINVGPLLAGSLWEETTAVLTSATIPPHLVDQVGLDPGDTEVLDVGSPFDYREHSILYVPRHLPDRRHPDAEQAIADELVALAQAAGGRTLALFTSYRAMETAAAAVRPRLGHPVLVQGDLPKGRLVQAFAADEPTCLFATMGYWQGIDVPGRSASLVVIDRIPFPRPDDPLLSARRELVGNGAFRIVDLPRAATLLAQGAGRLIRTATDRGVVAVLDPRLANAGYRRALLDALPPMRRSVDRDAVVAFLRDCAAAV